MKAREERIPAPFRKLLSEASARIVPFYKAWGKPDRLAEWRKRLEQSAATAPKT
jgi:hypothetical protein